MIKHLRMVDRAVIAASITGVGLAIAIAGCGFFLGKWIYATPNRALEQSVAEAMARPAPAAVGALAVAPTIEETTGTIPLVASLAGPATAQAPPSAAPRNRPHRFATIRTPWGSPGWSKSTRLVGLASAFNTSSPTIS